MSTTTDTRAEGSTANLKLRVSASMAIIPVAYCQYNILAYVLAATPAPTTATADPPLEKCEVVISSTTHDEDASLAQLISGK